MRWFLDRMNSQWNPAAPPTSNVPSNQWNAGSTSAPTDIYRTPEPTATMYSIFDWAYGLESGMGQAQGGVSKPTPASYYSTGPQKEGGFNNLSSAFLGPAQGGFKRVPGQGPTYQTLKGGLAELHNLPPEKLAAYTQRLYAAGFYPDRSYSKGSKPPSGRVVTQEDVMATVNLISTAQRYIKEDGTIIKTIDEIINEFTEAGEGQKKMDSLQPQREGRTYQVITSDPADLRAQVTRVGQAILGRALSDEETAALVEQMSAAERAPQEAAIAAGATNDAGQDVRLASVRVDTEARINERIKAQNPNEAQAYSEMNYYNVMREMIGGS